jgi:hypothetical protein
MIILALNRSPEKDRSIGFRLTRGEEICYLIKNASTLIYDAFYFRLGLQRRYVSHLFSLLFFYLLAFHQVSLFSGDRLMDAFLSLCSASPKTSHSIYRTALLYLAFAATTKRL